jgi:undecaprenyl-diphosphatase
MVELDRNLFLYLNSLHSPFWDNIMWFMSAKLVWIPLYLFIIYLLWRKYRGKIWLVFIFAVFAIVMADQLSVFIKNSFHRLRPCRDESISNLVHLVGTYCGGKFGFVSSHAANTFALASLTAPMLQKRWYSISIFVWAALVSYSRIYVGVHYPGDVLGGTILGLLIGFGLYFGFRWTINKNIVPEMK